MSDRHSETPKKVRKATRHLQEVQERTRKDRAEKRAREEAERLEREEAARCAEATRLAEEARRTKEERKRTEMEERAGKHKATTPEAGSSKRPRKHQSKACSELRTENEEEEELDAPFKR